MFCRRGGAARDRVYLIKVDLLVAICWPGYAMIALLADPLVAPLRRFIPLIGGVDLSPLAAIVLLQVAGMIAGSVLGSLIR